MNPDIARRRHEKSAQAKHGDDRNRANGGGHADHAKINVGESERQLSLLGGTVLAVCGLMRGSISGLGLAAIGGALIWRGYSGHCEVYHMLGHSTADHDGNKHSPTGAPAHEHFEPHLQGYESHAAGEAG